MSEQKMTRERFVDLANAIDRGDLTHHDETAEALRYAAEILYQNARLWDRLWGWQQDAAARLEQYCGLVNSGLIGAPEQVCVSLISPTLAMLEIDITGQSAFDPCSLCGADIRPGDRFAPVGLGDEYDVGEACSKCAPEHANLVKDEINLTATIAHARATLTQENTP